MVISHRRFGKTYRSHPLNSWTRCVATQKRAILSYFAAGSVKWRKKCHSPCLLIRNLWRGSPKHSSINPDLHIFVPGDSTQAPQSHSRNSNKAFATKTNSHFATWSDNQNAVFIQPNHGTVTRLRAARFTVRIPAGTGDYSLVQNAQTSSRVHPVSYSVGKTVKFISCKGCNLMYTDEGYSFSRIMCVVLTCCWSRLYVSIRKVLRPATSAQVLLGFPVSVYKRMLRWFSVLQVATACFSCSPPRSNQNHPNLCLLCLICM